MHLSPSWQWPVLKRLQDTVDFRGVITCSGIGGCSLFCKAEIFICRDVIFSWMACDVNAAIVMGEAFNMVGFVSEEVGAGCIDRALFRDFRFGAALGVLCSISSKGCGSEGFCSWVALRYVCNFVSLASDSGVRV